MQHKFSKGYIFISLLMFNIIKSFLGDNEKWDILVNTLGP